MGQTHRHLLNVLNQSTTVRTQECCGLSSIYPGRNTQLNNAYTVIFHLSLMSSKKGEHDCWRSKDEIISDVLLWTPKHGHTRVGRPYKTYIKQICEDIGCQSEDLPRAMEDRADWRERVWKIRAISTI